MVDVSPLDLSFPRGGEDAEGEILWKYGLVLLGISCGLQKWAVVGSSGCGREHAVTLI